MRGYLDEFVEGLCERFYHARLGRPSLRPGVYFWALLIGYFEGIDSERGMAADRTQLRALLRDGWQATLLAAGSGRTF
jgi:transposase